MPNLSLRDRRPLDGNFRGLDFDDRYGDFRRHLGMKSDLHLCAAKLSDGMLKMDFALIDLNALRSQSIGNVLGGHRPEKLVILADIDWYRDGGGADFFTIVFQRGLLLLGLLADHPLGMLDCLEAAAGGFYRFVPWDQVIPRESAGNLEHIPDVSHVVDVFTQNNFHRRTPF